MSFSLGNVNISDIYYGATKIADAYLGYTHVYQSLKPLTLTLETDGHGTLTANTVTGMPGDTVELTTAYNTYYRFSGYNVTGGTINGNTFTFGDEDATVYAAFKPNAFTATGGWEKGSDLLCEGDGRSTSSPIITANLPMKYALISAYTGDIPASWYSTSNRWNPSNASAYNATLKPIAKLSGWKPTTASLAVANANMVMRVANANTQAQDISFGTTREAKTYSKNFTTTSQSVYGISGKFNTRGYSYTKAFIKYLSSGTTGTWSATGYAP